jgi:hypothetical protein
VTGAVLAIDPGVAGHGNACAAFVGGELAEVWFERVPTFAAMPAEGPRFVKRYEQAGRVSVVVVERPVYQGKRSDNARAKDLIDLPWEGALLAGAFAGRDGCPIVALPSSDAMVLDERRRGWKGPEAKPANHWRLWQILNERERALLGGAATEKVIAAAREKGALSRWSKPGVAYYPRAWDTHNKLCAAALGATFLGRMIRVA